MNLEETTPFELVPLSIEFTSGNTDSDRSFSGYSSFSASPVKFSDIEVSSVSEVSPVSDVELPPMCVSPMSASEHSPKEERNISPIEDNKQCLKKRKKKLRKKKQMKRQIIMTEYDSENETVADLIPLQKIKNRPCQSEQKIK